VEFFYFSDRLEPSGRTPTPPFFSQNIQNKGQASKIFKDKDFERMGPGGDARRSTITPIGKGRGDYSAPFF
jgi:hypothetical protein